MSSEPFLKIWLPCGSSVDNVDRVDGLHVDGTSNSNSNHR